MSENIGPAIPRFSEMFRFADDSDLNQHSRELIAEAFAYGITLALSGELQAEPPLMPKEPPPPPKRAQEIPYFSRNTTTDCAKPWTKRAARVAKSPSAIR